MTQEISIFTEQGFATTFKIAEAMVKSGILPRGIDNPYKAFAIIQKGREMGVEPMRALTGIYLIEGKTVVSPELKLECFRSRGGKVQWLDSSEKLAHVKLTSSDGSTHEERVTIAEMQGAGLTGKDNWRKYPKSMLRARCIAFALRAMGEGDGSYTPDELGAVTDEEGNAQPDYTPPAKQEAPQDHPKARVPPAEAEARSASVDATPVTGASPPSKPRTAADVKPTGGPITPDQIKALHTLRGKVGGMTEDLYRKAIAVYRKADGSRCVGEDGLGTSKELSKDQASHLLNRLEDKITKQAERAGTGIDLSSSVPPEPVTPTLSDLLASHMDSSEDASGWLHAMFGLHHVQDLEAEEVKTAFALLAAYGTPRYDAEEEKARALGKIR